MPAPALLHAAWLSPPDDHAAWLFPPDNHAPTPVYCMALSPTLFRLQTWHSNQLPTPQGHPWPTPCYPTSYTAPARLLLQATITAGAQLSRIHHSFLHQNTAPSLQLASYIRLHPSCLHARHTIAAPYAHLRTPGQASCPSPSAGLHIQLSFQFALSNHGALLTYPTH